MLLAVILKKKPNPALNKKTQPKNTYKNFTGIKKI